MVNANALLSLKLSNLPDGKRLTVERVNVISDSDTFRSVIGLMCSVLVVSQQWQTEPARLLSNKH